MEGEMPNIPADVKWRRNSFADEGEGPELLRIGNRIFVHRAGSTDPAGIVEFTPGEMDAFLQGAKAHEFDDYR
jgi:hypothetical protein